MLRLGVQDLGCISYADAYKVQSELVERIVSERALANAGHGVLLLVEHPPIITVSARAAAAAHVLASPPQLARAGVQVVPTDRGGGVTYHGPGQLVVYPILDLNALSLRLHDYLRLLEAAVIRAVGGFGVRAHRDPGATGVWVGNEHPAGCDAAGSTRIGSHTVGGGAKLCAMGVRIRRWVTMHGLALNVTTNLSHFELIIPCGLVGRHVTSLERELGELCPGMDAVKRELVESLRRELEDHLLRQADRARAQALDV